MRLTIGRKLTIGFGVVVALMAVTYVFGLRSGEQVAKAQSHAQDMSRFSKLMVERVVDHFRWLDGLNTTIVTNAAEVTVQTDPTQCALGKWLQSDEVQRLAELDPAAGALVKNLHEPHKHLHATAREIAELWQPRHTGLRGKLWLVREQHAAWAREVANAIITDAKQVDVEMNGAKCGFGQFLHSDQYAQWIKEFPALGQALEPIRAEHLELHKSARAIESALASGDRTAAMQIYAEKTLPVMARVGEALEEAVVAEQRIIANQGKAVEVLDTKTDQYLALTQDVLNKLQEHLDQRAQIGGEDVKAALGRMNFTNLILFLIASGLAIAAGWLLGRAIVGAAKKLLGSFEKVGAGDLTERCELKSNDELGDLANGFNDLTKTLNDVIGDVDMAAREVAGASTEIAASSEEMAQGLSEQSSQMAQVSSATEQMSQSVVEVARKSGEAANISQQAGDRAAAGGKVVNETIEGMNLISQTVALSAESVGELGKRGEQIGQIVEVINDIADQTNLLALNAAIEAARAGEHGRGFAVVADEVRKLADRTTKATEEIAESIQAIQTETQQAVSKMNAGTEQVQSGVEKASAAGETLQQIVEGASAVSSMVQSIAAAAEQQSAAAEQVSQNIESINAIANQSNEGSQQAAAAAAQLSGKAEQLQALVGRFKIARG